MNIIALKYFKLTHAIKRHVGFMVFVACFEAMLLVPGVIVLHVEKVGVAQGLSRSASSSVSVHHKDPNGLWPGGQKASQYKRKFALSRPIKVGTQRDGINI